MAISRHMSTTEQQSALAGQSASVAQLVDVILDKGIVIDAWVRVSVVGLEVLTIEARVVVASVDTYLRYAEAIGLTAPAAPPPQQQAAFGGRTSTIASWRARCYAVSPSIRKGFSLTRCRRSWTPRASTCARP